MMHTVARGARNGGASGAAESGRRRRAWLVLLAAAVAAIGSAGCDDSDDDGLDAAKGEAVDHVHSAAVTLGNDLANIRDPRDQIMHIARYIEPIRFYKDRSGYFYVYAYNCVNVAHATQKNLVGQNLYNYTDSRGKFVIRELSAAAQAGGGFVEDYWIKPGEQGEKLKIGYVEPIPGTGYFIGSGVYLE